MGRDGICLTGALTGATVFAGESWARSLCRSVHLSRSRVLVAEATPSPRSNRRIGLLVVILTVLIASAAVIADVALRQNVEKSQRSEVLLLRLQGLSHHLSALEWQSIGEEQVSLETGEDVQSTRGEMVRIMGVLEHRPRRGFCVQAAGGCRSHRSATGARASADAWAP